MCIHVLEIDLNDIVELIVYDEAVTFNTNHDVHLHGFDFAVVAMDKVNFTLLSIQR